MTYKLIIYNFDHIRLWFILMICPQGYTSVKLMIILFFFPGINDFWQCGNMISAGVIHNFTHLWSHFAYHPPSHFRVYLSSARVVNFLYQGYSRVVERIVGICGWVFEYMIHNTSCPVFRHNIMIKTDFKHHLVQTYNCCVFLQHFCR